MSGRNTQKPMTDAEANAKIRKILKRRWPSCLCGYGRELFIGNKIVILIIDGNTQKPMTDAEANAKINKILKRRWPSCLCGYGRELFIGNKIVILISDGKIFIKESGRGGPTNAYKMDTETSKLASSAYENAKKKQERRDKITKKKQECSDACKGFFWDHFGAFFVGGVVILGRFVYVAQRPARDAAARNQAIEAQVHEYATSLPNYDDSIRLAQTDEELQNAINRREQARLKIAHYNDSLRAMSK